MEEARTLNSPVFVWGDLTEDMTTYLYNLVYFAVTPAPKPQRFLPRWTWLLILGLMLMLGSDLFFKVQQARTAALVEQQSCAREYTLNECEPERRIPMAHEYCKQMEICMQLDPLQTALATVLSAQLAGDIINGFVEALSYKSLAVLVVFLLCAIRLCTRGKA